VPTKFQFSAFEHSYIAREGGLFIYYWKIYCLIPEVIDYIWQEVNYAGI